MAKSIVIKPLTADAFSDFGDVIEAHEGDGFGINQGLLGATISWLQSIPTSLQMRLLLAFLVAKTVQLPFLLIWWNATL